MQWPMLLSYAPGGPLRATDLEGMLRDALCRVPVDGRRVCAVVPDATRSLPMPEVFHALCDSFASRARQLQVLIALGTHPPMSDGALAAHLGYSGRPPDGVEVTQHRWNESSCLTRCGVLERSTVHSLSQGLLDEPVEVRVNRAVLDADLTLLVGPVFPHELIGFSGGHKYLFPGVSGPEMVDYTHWLGALLTNPCINGHRDTPPRAVIEAAAGLVPGDRYALCLVVKGHDAHGLFLGRVYEAWQAAVELSSRLNIAWVDRPFNTVLATVPERYEDLWTGSKAMTKLEPVVADGGTLTLYAPHIASPSLSHAGWHERIGYHVRDYILAHHRERFPDVPLAVLADLMQLPGTGSYHDGVETRRIRVLLASAIPPAMCRKINLEYLDPASIRLDDYRGREEQGCLLVEQAGETLYRPRG